jgi:signal transduction histidine kinase/CheY-like chemotaxis protein
VNGVLAASVRRCAFALALSSLAAGAAAAEPLRFDPRARQVDLGPALEIFRDRTGRLGPEEVAGARFEPHPGRAGLLFPEGALWVRVTVENPAAEPRTWFLVFDDALLARLDVWMALPGGMLHRRGGYAVPRAERTIEMHGPWHELPLMLMPEERVEILARLESPGPIHGLVRLAEGVALGQDFVRRIVQQGVHLGILLALAVLNLYSYLALRERGYLAFLALSASYAAFELFESGLGAALVLREAAAVNAVAPPFFAALSIFFALHFADAFLGVRPGRVARVVSWAALAAALVALLDPRLGNLAACAAAALAIPLVGLRALVGLQGGSRAGWFFALAMAPLAPAAVAYGLTAAGLVPETLAGRHFIHIAFSLTGFVVAFALADRVRTADEAARATLEGAVAARTAELATTVEALRREAEERHRAELARRESEEKLRHAQRIEAVGRLAGGIAHDYNNLLTSVTTNVAILRMEPEPTPQDRQLILADVAEASDRGAALTRQLLAFSRRQVLSPQPLEVNRVVQGIRRLLDRLLGENYLFRLNLGSPLPRVVADPSQVEQVLMNLVLNARDAMPGGGTIDVTTSETTVGGEGSGGAAPGRYVRITVADSGTGIDPSVFTHIFEPFFTTKPEGKGTGLGLATVHGIVTQHGGFLEVDPGAGRGATFHVHFPAAPEGSTEAAASPDRLSSLPGGDEPVMLVEDDPVVRESTRRLLARLGYRVSAACDAGEALRLCAEGASPALVITDLVMPGMDGLALVEQVRLHCPQAGVLLVSGHAHDILTAHGVTAKGLPFLSKPFSAAALAAAVRDGILAARKGQGGEGAEGARRTVTPPPAS